MWSAIFGGLQQAVVGENSFVVFLRNCLNAILSLFVNIDTTGTTPTYSLTDFGTVFFLVVGIGILYGLMSWVIRLMKLRG